jgi:hypothetical protein
VGARDESGWPRQQQKQGCCGGIDHVAREDFRVRRLLSGADLNHEPGGSSLGSFTENALTQAHRPFSAVRSKIGIGDDGFRHDCAIVERDALGTSKPRYVIVVLGWPKSKFTEFTKLVQDVDAAMP